MSRYAVYPDGPGPIKRGIKALSPKGAAIAYAKEHPMSDVLMVESHDGTETKFRISEHAAQGWGNGTVWHSVIATEIRPEEGR